MEEEPVWGVVTIPPRAYTSSMKTSASSRSSSWSELEAPTVAPNADSEELVLIHQNLETTVISAMASIDMTRPLPNNQEYPEVLLTSTSNVADWADEQSSSENPSQHTLVRCSLTFVTRFQQHQPIVKLLDISNLAQNHTESSATHERVLIVYDIATLLKLREAMDGNRVELRINPAALAGKLLLHAAHYLPIAPHRSLDSLSGPYFPYTTLIQLTYTIVENLFKDYTNTRFTHQKKTVSRGLSNFTHRSTNSDEELTFEGRYMHQPSRQPRAPPQTPHAQQSEGFARFLKEHASPPHHRVTAGGRIVPAGPLSPPPMLTLNSITAVLEKQSGLPETSRKNDQSDFSSNGTQAVNTESSLRKSEKNGIGLGIGNLNSSVQGHGTHGAGYGNEVIQPLATSAYAMQPTGLMTQFPPGSVSTMMLQDGSTVYPLNGTMYRSYWNGTEIAVESLNVHSSAPALQSYPLASSASMQPWFGTQSSSNPQTVLGNVASGTQTYVSPLNQDLRAPALHNQFQNLQSQLMALDKHMALHLHELPPTVHAGMVAKRRELVERLDAVRVAKEQFERSGSTVTPLFSPYSMGIISDQYHSLAPMNTVPNFTIPAATVQPGSIAPQFASTSATMENTSGVPKTAVDHVGGACNNKGLSPSAPAFIPSFAQRTASATGSLRNAELNQHVYPHHTVASSGNVSTLYDNQSARAPSSSRYEIKDAPLPMYQQQMHSTQPSVNYRSAAASNLGSSTEDALPLVSDQEVEYVDRLRFNPASGPKFYCTMPGEFQEVIRRAREQARMFGCLGGQSKDPAYDAEQDIRWAMADFEPIQLPKQTPDHFLKPRPWNWNDSAYNYRVVGPMVGGNSESGAAGNPVFKSSKNLTKEATFPSTPIKASTYDLEKRQRANSWGIDSGKDGWQETNTVRFTEAGPSESAQRNGSEDAASRGPLFATSGNSYRSQSSKKPYVSTAQFSPSDTTKEYHIPSKAMAQINANEDIDLTKVKDKQPETPRRRPYHAYVESYSGSPSTPRDKYPALSVPAEVAKDNIITNDQGLSEESLSVGTTDPWGLGSEDTASYCSWGKPKEQAKKETSSSGIQVTAASKNMFDLPGTSTSTWPDIKKEIPSPKKHAYAGSWRLVTLYPF